METQKFETFERTNSTIIGLQQVYQENEILNRVRYAVETLCVDPNNSKKILDDFIVLVKTYMNFPLFSHLERFLTADTDYEAFLATLKIIDHLSYHDEYADIHLYLKTVNFEMGEETSRSKKLFVRLLENFSRKEELVFCETLSSIYQEQDAVTKIKKTLAFLNDVYDDPALLHLMKAYEHLVSLNSELQFYSFVHRVSPSDLVDAVKDLAYSNVEINIWDAFSKGQMMSKEWATSELIKVLKLQESSTKSALVLCGWVAVLPHLLFRGGFKHIVSIDRDPACEIPAQKVNHFFNQSAIFESKTEDIFNVNYEEELKNLQNEAVIINTSCEHIGAFEEWFKMLPKGQLLLLQSNNYFDINEHVNCVSSLEEFKSQAPMSKTLFEGSLPFENYTRFMLIGYK